MDGESAKCVFCGETKMVSRYYMRVANKHFDNNKKGNYSTYVAYCADCGILPDGLDIQLRICKDHPNGYYGCRDCT